jgi:hypothetical protein
MGKAARGAVWIDGARQQWQFEEGSGQVGIGRTGEAARGESWLGKGW